MQIVLKTPKGPVALPRWMPLLLLAELVLVVLVLVRGMGTFRSCLFLPADMTNQYAESLVLDYGQSGKVTPDQESSTLPDTLTPDGGEEEKELPSLLVSQSFPLPAGRYKVTVRYAAGQDAQLQLLPESADIINMNVDLPATGQEEGLATGIVWLEQGDKGLQLVFDADHLDWELKSVEGERQGWYDITFREAFSHGG